MKIRESATRDTVNLVTGVVLAGGAGRRMQGADKGLLTVDGEASVARVARSLAPHCSYLLISANRNIEEYKHLGIGEVISDQRPDFAGPLAGLEAVRGKAHTDVLVVAPCDLPHLTPSIYADLLEALLSDPTLDAVYASCESGPHYLCAALRLHCLQTLPQILDDGVRAVRHWYATLHTRAVPFEEAKAECFQNLNVPADWDDLRPKIH